MPHSSRTERPRSRSLRPTSRGSRCPGEAISGAAAGGLRVHLLRQDRAVAVRVIVGRPVVGGGRWRHDGNPSIHIAPLWAADIAPAANVTPESHQDDVRAGVILLHPNRWWCPHWSIDRVVTSHRTSWKRRATTSSCALSECQSAGHNTKKVSSAWQATAGLGSGGFPSARAGRCRAHFRRTCSCAMPRAVMPPIQWGSSVAQLHFREADARARRARCSLRGAPDACPMQT